MSPKPNTDRLMRAISLLTALQNNTKNANEFNDISDSHVTEFHTTLSSIADMGIDIKEFRIPDSELNPQVLVSKSGRERYSEKKYVRKSIFLTKLEGIIIYLNFILKKPKPRAGFKSK
jgi:hypothetical protein